MRIRASTACALTLSLLLSIGSGCRPAAGSAAAAALSSGTVTAPAGSAHDCWTQGLSGSDSCVTALTSTTGADGTYQVTLSGITPLSSAYQAVGLMLAQDEHDFLRFELWSRGQGVLANGYAVQGNSGSQVIAGPSVQLSGSVTLRVVKAGTRYTFSYSLDGTHYVTAGSTSSALAIQQAGPYADNSNANVLTSADYAQLTVPSSTGSTSAVVSSLGGRCLDVTGVSHSVGAPLQIWDCSQGANQSFSLSGGSVEVYGSLCLAASGDGNSAPVVLATCDGSATQQWSYDPSSGTFTGFQGRCLDVRGGNSADGTPVQLYDCNGTGAQKWTFQSAPVAPAPPPPLSGGALPLDCASSSQPALCAYLASAATPQSAPGALSSACQNPAHPVQATPGNFATVLAGVQAGQTVLFAPGTYEVTQTLNLVSGVSYCGQGGDASGVVLDGSTLGWIFQGGDLSSITIDGLTLNGSGINANSYTHFYLQNSVVENIRQRSWPVDQVLLVPLANDLHVVHNTFRNDDGGINAYNLNSVSITDNSFSAVDEGMHLMFQGPDDNIRIARNRFVEGRRIMIELQGNAPFGPLTNLVVEDNVILFPYQGGYPDTYGMGISAAIPGIAQNPIFRNNWLFGPQGNYQTLGVLAFEVAGNGDSFSGNVIQYWNSAFSISNNGPTISIRDNSVCDVPSVFSEDGGFNGWTQASGNTCQENAQGYATP